MSGTKNAEFVYNTLTIISHIMALDDKSWCHSDENYPAQTFHFILVPIWLHTVTLMEKYT